jgi:hypothetical protein
VTSPWLGVAVDADRLERARLLRRAHELVLSGRPHPAFLRDVVLDSWLRSARAGVDPSRPAPRMLTAGEAAARLAAHQLGRLMPLMRSMLSSVAEEARHIMVLSDADGLLLWADGHPKMLEAAATTHFLPGGLCSEEAAGTNAVGTTLTVDHPLQIFSAEHFSSLFHGWACSAAPIHEPSTGDVLGAINLSGNFRTAHPHSLSLVAAVARVAESQLALEAARHDEHLRDRYLALVMRNSNRPSALVTRAGRVVIASPPSWLPDQVTVPRDQDRFTLGNGLEVVVEPLESGDAYMLWQVDRPDRTAPSAKVRLEALGRRRALLSQIGGNVELSPRHSEILTLLMLQPNGLSSDELALQIYGSDVQSVTIRAEMSRLRKLLGCLLLAKPYRLVAEVEADFIEVERLLDAGAIAEAGRQHPGPLLTTSNVPLIVAARDRIERRLAAAAAPART